MNSKKKNGVLNPPNPTETNRSIATGTIVERIGNTPLIPLRRVVPGHIASGVRLFAKCEWFNPGGSVKDRPAWSIVRQALESGALAGEKRLLDSTSGNTGIAYAMIGAALNVPVTLVMPNNVSQERRSLIQAYGAEIEWSDPMEGSDGARSVAKQLLAEYPDRYFYADQYNNDANWRAHYQTTGPEIWNQTETRITHFVAGLGTSGTVMGVSRFLKEQNPAIQCVALQPEPFHGIEGWKHMESAIPVGIFDSSLPDDILTLPTEPAYRLARELAAKEGLLASPSSGAALYGALQVAEPLTEANVVVVFADGGDKYLSTGLYS